MRLNRIYIYIYILLDIIPAIQGVNEFEDCSEWITDYDNCAFGSYSFVRKVKCKDTNKAYMLKVPRGDGGNESARNEYEVSKIATDDNNHYLMLPQGMMNCNSKNINAYQHVCRVKQNITILENEKEEETNEGVIITLSEPKKTFPICLFYNIADMGSLTDRFYEKNDSILDEEINKNYLNWFLNVSIGLFFLGLKGIIHRDIQPGNILLNNIDENIFAYLSDFGMSVEMSNILSIKEYFKKKVNKEYFSESDQYGNYYFTSPEITKYYYELNTLQRKYLHDTFSHEDINNFERDYKYTIKSDVYMLGVTFIVLLNKTKHYPFFADDNTLRYLENKINHVNQRLNILEYNYNKDNIYPGNISLEQFKILIELLRSMIVEDPDARVSIIQVVTTLRGLNPDPPSPQKKKRVSFEENMVKIARHGKYRKAKKDKTKSKAVTHTQAVTLKSLHFLAKNKNKPEDTHTHTHTHKISSNTTTRYTRH
eukprot:GHVR01165262.1.p1 GENE.GHVR01165262.1~~GHVR01165262.1.p1  ORF type:complete len:498 (+),score=138.28 GHVR01165262.1:49-1494(+)